MSGLATRQFTFRPAGSTKVGYLLFLPKDYDRQARKRWPLILFLHGAGERGRDLRLVAKHGPPKIAAARPDFPFIVVAPQCPQDETWSEEVLLGLLGEVARNCMVDQARVYLTGISMGGYGTWRLGLRHPGRFAAMAPICGGGDLIDLLLAGTKAGALRKLAVWAFHGAKDPVVPLEESQRMVRAFKLAGGRDVRLTVYPDARHDAWTETYSNPEFYHWLLRHERKESRKRV